MIRRIFSCPLLKSGKPCADSTCLTAFTKAFGFTKKKTVEDGDCFFHSLELYGKETGFHALNRDRQTLREEMVTYLLANPDLQYLNQEDIMTLYEPGKYDCDAGDLPSQFAHMAFGLNVSIFDLYEDDTESYINQIRYTVPRSQYTVNLLRTGEHYQLLLTKNQPDTNAKINTSAHANAPKAEEKARRNRMKVHATERMSRKTAKQSRSRSHSRNTSLERAFRNIALYESDAAKADAAKATNKRYTAKK